MTNDPSDKFAELRERAEALIRSRANTPVETPSDVIELIHELNLHQAELEIQNEELRRSQEEVAALHREYADLYEFAPCGYLTLNPKGIITHANLTGVRLLGVNRESLFHSTFSVFLDPGSEGVFLAARRDAAETGRKRTVELRIERQDGAVLWVQAAIEAERDAREAVVQWRVILVDVTERIALQDRLAEARKMEVVGQLAGGVAHNFNNLLAGIMNYVELCRDGVPPEHPIRDYLDEMDQEARRAADLAGQLLGFACKQTIRPAVLELNDTVSRSLALLRGVIDREIVITWAPSAALWSIKMDAAQVDRLLVALCTNAVDAIDGAGRILVKTRNVAIAAAFRGSHADVPAGEYVLLTVSDNGRGMDNATIGRLFEPFFTTKRSGLEAGLGLAAVYGIVVQNHGFTDVTSEPGKGTTIKVYLPRFVAKTPRDAVVAPTRPLRGTETVLLVDDEKSVLVTTRMFLQNLGYTVLDAEDPEQALRLAEGHDAEIHLLITDVVMPGMDGRALAAKLAKAYPRMRCLFMSGYTANVIAHRGILDEHVHFLSKPFTRDELAKKVREVLDG